jgi:hypothetical protein
MDSAAVVNRLAYAILSDFMTRPLFKLKPEYLDWVESGNPRSELRRKCEVVSVSVNESGVDVCGISGRQKA